MAQMNFAQTVDVLVNFPIAVSIFLSSNHGMGKDAAVYKAASMKGKMLSKVLGKETKCEVIDIRFSQKDVGDITGMPFLVDGRSFNGPPIWMPVDQTAKELLAKLTKVVGEIESGVFGEFGYLFLNELTYASKELQQAGFELVLDRRLGMFKVAPGWRVVSAGNTNTKIYRNPLLGPALISRFAWIDFVPTVEEWKKHAYEAGFHPAIRGFHDKRADCLDPKEDVILANPGQKLYDRRSWDLLSQTLLHYEKLFKEGLYPYDILSKGEHGVQDYDGKVDPELNFLYSISSSFLGSTMGSLFKDYVKNDYKELDADAILNRWSEDIEKIINTLVETGERENELSMYNGSIHNYVKNANRPLTELQSKNLLAYVKCLPNDLVVDFWKHFDLECHDIARAWFNNPVLKAKIKGEMRSEAAVFIMSAMEKPKGIKAKVPTTAIDELEKMLGLTKGALKGTKIVQVKPGESEQIDVDLN